MQYKKYYQVFQNVRCIFYQFLRKLTSSYWILRFEVFEISVSSKLSPLRMKISYSCFSFIFIYSVILFLS